LAGLEVLTPAEAIALCPGAAPARSDDAAQAELLQAIRDVADAVELASAPASLFARLLEVAVAATGATGGSLLLVEDAVLRVRAAAGLEPELWAKVRLAIGARLAGRAWAEARPFSVSGRADPAHFEIAHERPDVASALLAPLAHAGSVHGVLCLHHTTEADRFAALDLDWAGALGAALARAVERALAMQAAERGAERDAIAVAVERALGAATPRAERDAALCRIAAEYAGAGSATLWRTGAEADAERLRFAASSLTGGALGAPTELTAGQGLDGRAARTCEALFLRDADRLAYAALPLVGADATLLGSSRWVRRRGARSKRAPLRSIAEAARLPARRRGRTRTRRHPRRSQAATEIAAHATPIASRHPRRACHPDVQAVRRSSACSTRRRAGTGSRRRVAQWTPWILSGARPIDAPRATLRRNAVLDLAPGRRATSAARRAARTIRSPSAC
jgi:hypothetical protein